MALQPAPSVVRPPDRSPWPRRIAWAVVVAVVFVIGYAWLDPGFPESWQVDVTKWFDAFGVWAVENRTTSPLFVLLPHADRRRRSRSLYDNILTASSG